MLIDEKYNLVISIFGRRGSGKTWLSCDIARGFDKIMVFDTRDRIGWKKGQKTYDAIMEGIPVYFTDALIDLVAKEKKKFCYIYKPYDPEADFEAFCQICDTEEVNDTLVYIEEIGLVTHSQHITGIPPAFGKLLRFGRHHNIFLLLNSQRPQDVHRAITAESSHIIVFNMIEQRDIAYFTGYIKESGDLPKLGQYQFMMWHEGATVIYGKDGKPISKAVQ